jgi:hypothetical protein
MTGGPERMQCRKRSENVIAMSDWPRPDAGAFCLMAGARGAGDREKSSHVAAPHWPQSARSRRKGLAGDWGFADG